MSDEKRSAVWPDGSVRPGYVDSDGSVHETRIPSWAVKRAIDFGGEVGDGQNAIEPLARLLVTVREKALREAANLKIVQPSEWPVSGCLVRDEILSLIDKEPS